MKEIVEKLESLKKNLTEGLCSRLGLSAESGVSDINAESKKLRIKQVLLLSGGGAIILVGGLYFCFSGEDRQPLKSAKPVEKSMSTLATPLSPVDERETWVSRVEKKAETLRQETHQVHQQNELLEKRLDVLEELFKGQTPIEAPISETEQPIVHSRERPVSSIPPASYGAGPTDNAPPKRRGPKIVHLTGHRLSNASLKSSDLYLPGGTYCKAVVDMGVAASTATNSQGNPEPIKLRLVDDGNLPGGLKGQVRDAVLIGACYGDISSERARCRLETLTWKDKNGTQIEKAIEGWVVGEDGLAGIRGQVVDRSGAVAREAFGAGLLSAAANFLKFEATAGVFPTSPFGQTNALSKEGALKGAAASGAGSALDKLAEFSIKRAEQMQPVILVASGRVVDVLLKSGVSLTPENDNDLKVVGGTSSTPDLEASPQDISNQSQEG
jgi:conjugal transfer pilus assembly protein TraB